MKLSLVILTAALIEGCFGAYWPPNHNHGQRRPMQRMGRDRPRPMRHNRHIQPHHGYPIRPPPPRMHRPGPPPPPPGSPGHRRASRPPPPLPPQFRQTNFPVHTHTAPNQQNQGAMMIQPMIHNGGNMIHQSDHRNPLHQHHHHSPHPPQLKELGVPPTYFQQDEIIQEQSKHFPVTTIANPNQLHSPNLPNPFQSLKDSQPHGYLSSTYKGWKPIVKPYQNSYMSPATSPGGGNHLSSGYGMYAQSSMYPSHSSQPSPALNLDTLFREQTEHMKNHGLKQAFSENNGVRVKAPTVTSTVKTIKAVELPLWNKRLSTGPNQEQHQQQQQQQQNVEQVKKPFNRPKLIPKNPVHQTNGGQAPPSSTEDSPQDGQKFQKFKFRQRPRPGTLKQDAAQESQQADRVTSVLPPFPHKHHPEELQSSVAQDGHGTVNPKPKLPSRGRVRVRTTQKPDIFSSEESSKPGQGGEPSSTENFPGRRNPQFGRPVPQRPPGPEGSEEETGQQGPNHFFDRDPSGQHQEKRQQQAPTDGRPPPHTRGHYRQHPPNEQRIRKPVSNLIDRPQTESPYAEGSSDSKEGQPISPPPNQTPQRGRRKRPKDGNKNKISSNDPTQQQQQPLPAPPPPQFPDQEPFVEDNSYFPPGFHSDPSKNTGHREPVSFVTMPGGKPQVIHHNTFLRQQQQPLYPINVMRSPGPDFQRPTENYGSGGPNGNYVPNNNRPHFTTINVQNGPSQHQHHHRHGTHSQQNSHLPPPPPRFPHHQQNSGPVFTSNSNHEPSYFPSAFGSNSNHVPFGGPPPPSHSSPPPHQNMRRPPITGQIQQSSHSHPPMRFPPPPPMSSTTMRYPRYHSSSPPGEENLTFNSPSSSSSSFSSVEMRDSSESTPFTVRSVPPTSSTFPPSVDVGPPEFRPPTRNHPHHQNPERSNSQSIIFPEYAPAYSGSAEYDKIPMQFMEQLRPILRDDHPSGSMGSPNSHQSSDIHPPSSFFDEFFQPFGQSFNPNAEQELDSKPVPQGEKQYNNNFNTYDGYNAEPSSPQPHFARIRPENLSTPKYSTSSSSHSPIFSIPEVSPSSVVRNNDFDEQESNPVVWSKLQEQELQPVMSSTEQSFATSPHSPIKKYSKQVNQNKAQQYHTSTTTVKTRPESNPKVKGDVVYHHQIVDPKTEENVIFPPVTTYKPRFEEEEEDMGLREFGLKKYPTSTSTTITTNDQEDNVDSNTPKSVRFPVRDETQPIISSPIPESQESTTFKSRRHFRRRRPDAAVRRRFFSSRVKSVADEELQQQQGTPSPKSKSLGRPSLSSSKGRASSSSSSSTTTEEKQNGPLSVGQVVEDTGYEGSRVSPLMKQRRLLQRRKLSTSPKSVVKGIDDGSFTTTPSQPTSASSTAAESETVTYGESQWFRIKPTDSSELQSGSFSTLNNGSPNGLRLRSGTEDMTTKKKSLLSPPPKLLPLEPSSEISSTEASGAGVRTLYSSKHSVSYVDDRKFPVHTRKNSSSS